MATRTATSNDQAHLPGPLQEFDIVRNSEGGPDQVQGRVRPLPRLTMTPLAGARARHLPGGDVEAVPEVDQGDVDDQGRQRWLVIVPGGLAPDLVGYRVRPVAELRGGLGQRQRGAFGVGDFAALLAVLDPDVVLRADRAAVPAGASREVRGAPAVAKQALAFSGRARFAQPALVNGAAGVVVVPRGRLLVALGLTVTRGKIVEIDVVADPARLRQLDLAVLDD
jgi:hypothetical protein